MDPDKIKDRKSFEAWLKARPEEVRRREGIVLAHRSALRVFPIWGRSLEAAWASNRKLTALPLLRSLLTSGVAAHSPNPLIRVSAAIAVSSLDAIAAEVADHAAAYACEASDAARAADTHAAAAAAARAAAAAHAAALAADYVWEQVRDDARLILAGDDLFQAPLWSIPQPPWFHQFDTETRAIWRNDPPGTWDFWLDWWDQLRIGQPLDWALQEKVALIPDEVWKAGPGAVAAAIREIKTSSNRGQAEALLHAAIADYSFDALDRVMRLVPFEEDIRHLRAPERLVAFLDDAEATRDDIALFTTAMRSERQIQGAGFVARYLDEILMEFSRARQTDHLRVGRIVELGKILEDYAQDAEVAAEFGPAVRALRTHVGGLLDLTRRHFASTLTRMAPLRDISSSPDDNQWDLLQDIQRGIKEIARAYKPGLRPLAVEDQAVLLSMAESVERLLRQHDIVPTPEGKSSLRREVDFQLALVSVSVGLFMDRARENNLGPGKVLDGIATQYKRATGVLGLWSLIKGLWDKMG